MKLIWGYRLIKATWGNGYATEASSACIKYGLEKLHLSLLVGRALPENLASVRVLEKCGMNYVGEEIIEGLLHKTYDIHNPFIP
ncbi:MAG: GNAT family N-acetyltransferase [Chitinophagaceae bacterium]